MSLQSIQDIDRSYGPMVVSYVMTTGCAQFFQQGRWVLFVLRPHRLYWKQMVDVFILPENPELPENQVGSGYELLNTAIQRELMPQYTRYIIIARFWRIARALNEGYLKEIAKAESAEAELGPVEAKRRRDQCAEGVREMLAHVESLVKTYNHQDLVEIDQGENRNLTLLESLFRRLRLI
jgi:hypothetical protein